VALFGGLKAFIVLVGRFIGVVGDKGLRIIIWHGQGNNFCVSSVKMYLVVCPRCEQRDLFEARVKGRGVQIFACDECDAVWFSLADIGVSPFGGLETYLEESSIAPSWESISVHRHL